MLERGIARELQVDTFQNLSLILPGSKINQRGETDKQDKWPMVDAPLLLPQAEGRVQPSMALAPMRIFLH